jgi:hypothetical protein
VEAGGSGDQGHPRQFSKTLLKERERDRGRGGEGREGGAKEGRKGEEKRGEARDIAQMESSCMRPWI